MINIKFGSNKESKSFVLSLFDKTIDNEGYIIEQKSKKRVLSADGQEITLEEFGVIKNGSEIFAKDDIAALVRFYERYLSDAK
ncbi:MAG: hypothetical protein ABI758_02905 [Candidatus Woesebacteria bacterium]